jgi:hypothetical protein
MRLVEADSVADYLTRYYKRERMTPTLLASYEAELAERGYVCTSHHDNVTGSFIAWPRLPEWATPEADEKRRRRWAEAVADPELRAERTERLADEVEAAGHLPEIRR